MSNPNPRSRDHSQIVENNVSPIESNRRSNNIPLPLSHKHRTQSEVQLSEDMETAEQRDLNMFYRLVNGIRERQMTLVRENESSTAAAAYYNPAHALTEAERSLAHIIHTRNAPVDRKNGTSTSSTTTSFRINTTGRRSNNWHSNLNPGVPILEDQPTSDRDNGWAVGGFDSSSNLSVDQSYYQQQQQQHPSTNFGATVDVAMTGSPSYASPALNTSQSSSEVADEGMFDFEL